MEEAGGGAGDDRPRHWRWPAAAKERAAGPAAAALEDQGLERGGLWIERGGG